ncbi:hypothetical protein A2U01_0073478, partial [Trifolium medium]|nr:hypothetical protein [Trifolium medium]
VYRCHPTVAISDDIYVEDPGRFLNDRAREYFLDYRFVSAFPFRTRQLGQDICSFVMFSWDMLYLDGVESGDFFFYQR